MVAQHQISSPVFGIFVSPLGRDGTPEGAGEITFGGVDESKIQGDFRSGLSLLFFSLTWIALRCRPSYLGSAKCTRELPLGIQRINSTHLGYIPVLICTVQVSSFSFGTVNLTEVTVARTDTGVLSIGIPLYD